MRAGIPVFSYRHGGLEDVTATILKLGHRTGHAAEAHTVAKEIERDLVAIRASVLGRTPARTLIVIGREPGIIRNVYASGGIGFIHDMLEAAGGENVFGDVAREATQPSSETILAAAPEVIIELRAEGILTPGRGRPRDSSLAVFLHHPSRPPRTRALPHWQRVRRAWSPRGRGDTAVGGASSPRSV